MDPFQLLIFVVIALVYFVQWVARQSSRNQDDSTPPTIPRDSRVSRDSTRESRTDEEEKMRRFLEALGMPVETETPPRPAPAPPPTPAPRKAAPPPLPATRAPAPATPSTATTTATATVEADAYAVRSAPENAKLDVWDNRIKEAKRQKESAEQQLQAAQARANAAAAAKIAASEAPGERPSAYRHEEAYSILARMPVGKASTIRMLLRTTGGARQAVVLREVLGPPRALENQ